MADQQKGGARAPQEFGRYSKHAEVFAVLGNDDAMHAIIIASRFVHKIAGTN